MDVYKLLGDRLRRARKEQGLTQGELGNAIGMTGEAIGSYERGRRRPSIADLDHIARVLGVSITYFLARETAAEMSAAKLFRACQQIKEASEEIAKATDMVLLPVIGDVPGEIPTLVEERPADEQFPVPAYLFSRAIFTQKDFRKMYCLKVRGDSMSRAGILDGDTVAIEAGANPKPGNIVIARNGDEAVIRILRKDRAGLYLEAAAEGYEPLPISDEEIIGVVVYAGREYR